MVRFIVGEVWFSTYDMDKVVNVLEWLRPKLTEAFMLLADYWMISKGFLSSDVYETSQR